MSWGERPQLPVFVFPTQLQFAFSDPQSHKQILTLYNIYAFPLNYKVLSTAPTRYSVIEPFGTLRPRCCVDIVIRHLVASSRANIGIRDKFRIEIQKHDEAEVRGERVIGALLVEHRSEIDGTGGGERGERFEGMQSTRTPHSIPSQYPLPPHHNNQGGSQHWLAIVAALICIMALMLPNGGEESSRWPMLHLTLAQKLVAAYVLGICTMLLVRPT